MAVAAAVAIANGSLRAGLLLLVLTAVPDVLDGAVAKASGTASPRGAFFDSVVDRVSDALLLGGVAWYLDSPSRAGSRCCPSPCWRASMLISYERAKAESLGFDARGGLMERAERLILLGFGLLFESLLVPVLWVMLALTAVHRGPAVREGVAPGVGAPGPARSAPAGASRRVARSTQRTWRRQVAAPQRRRRPAARSPAPAADRAVTMDLRDPGLPRRVGARPGAARRGWSMPARPRSRRWPRCRRATGGPWSSATSAGSTPA